VIRTLIAALLATAPAAAVAPPGCTGSATLGTFQLSVGPFFRGSALPLKSMAAIPAGARLMWNPVHLPPQASGTAEVAVVLVPASGGDLIVLEPRKAGTRTEWQLLERPQVIALIFGPQGLSEGKIKSLVTRNRDLVREMADYAEQSSQVESLVQELADAEQSGGGADAVLKGFSSQYGVSPQKLNPKAASDQQAVLLLKTLLPASNAYDPLANRSAQVQQSGGLAASVAGMFFGNPVGLAAGGAALFQNLKTTLFPNTEFRSAFAQAADKDRMALCTKNQAPKSKTRIAYLWAYRVPELKKPVVSLVGTQHLPLGSKSTLALKVDEGSTIKELERARDWRLTPASGGDSIPVEVRPTPAGSLEIDLSKVNASAGDYQLASTWDWDPLVVAGTLHLHPYGDFMHVILASTERDKLIEGNGSLAVELAGADFEFLDKVSLESSARDAKAVDVGFTLPLGRRAGPQKSVTLNIDAAKRGSYRLLLTQSDGVAHAVPVAVLPPNPTISNLPIHLNTGEARGAIRLQGSGMERIESVSSDAGDITGAPDSHSWSGEMRLKTGLTTGQTLSLVLKVKGLASPVTVPDAIKIVGPRPRILSLQKSLAGALGIEIGADELPAGTAAGLVLTVNLFHDTVRPRLELGCEGGELRQSLTLAPGEPSGGASLTLAGPETLYLSVDPGAVGYAGCRLAATVTLDPEGRSDRFVLGRVIRVPRLDKFTLTTEKVDESSYVGTLEGRDLDVIEKVGWDAEHGTRVESIPTPVPGDPSRQTVRVVLPWPAPGPHAFLYVWLRGEARGRKTVVAY
jgi:hypothetical protein